MIESFYRRDAFLSSHSYPIAIDLISKGVVDVKPLITHRFKFEEVKKAFEFFRNGTDGAIKCMISCD